MSWFLGIDTSNYTTSACIYDTDSGEVISLRKLLPVKKGEKGLRQSDAVFHHTQQLSPLIEELFGRFDGKIDAIGVSYAPRTEVGSYMPCFTVGLNTAKILSAALHIPLYQFSHQQGHIAAALYSIHRLDLIDKPHIAFHISGGTTEAIAVNTEEGLLSTRVIAKTLDLNAGQLIDRVGVMLDLSFPCGRELESLALNCTEAIKVKTTLKGNDCCLSGGENQCRKLLDSGKLPEYVARYAIEYVLTAISEMTEKITKEYPGLPLVFAGGVMSDSIIREAMTARYDCLFSKPEFSSDNAAGVAVLASLTHQND
ncbi:MAG: peptidase M22 [Ruminococcus sp.]|nr:peptidase M22 [Ruminococcus sp.]